MPRRVVPSDEQLFDYSGEHLLYELEIFEYIVTNFPTEASFQLSVFLESFAIHLRNLIDFFYVSPGEAREDDIVAGDFFDVPDKWNPGALLAILEAARHRANKEVSHITYKRKSATDKTKPWFVSELFREVNAVARRFVGEASRNRLHPEVVRFLTTPKAVASAMLVGASTTSSNTVVIDSPVALFLSGGASTRKTFPVGSSSDIKKNST